MKKNSIGPRTLARFNVERSAELDHPNTQPPLALKRTEVRGPRKQ